MKAYLANGLFSEADQLYNKHLAARIRNNFPSIDLYVPQENAALNDKSGYANSLDIFKGDNFYLDSADLMIAVLDGLEIDSGVAIEIGRFITFKEFDKSKKRYIFGIYSDIRQQGRTNSKKIEALIADGSENQFMYRNLYAIGSIKANGFLVSSSDELIEKMASIIKE